MARYGQKTPEFRDHLTPLIYSFYILICDTEFYAVSHLVVSCDPLAYTVLDGLCVDDNESYECICLS